jgi:hypothetical protein
MKPCRAAIDEEDWPRCARCDTPVEDCFALTSERGTVWLVAQCHGDEQTIRLDAADLDDIEAATVTVGLAFAGPERGDHAVGR